MRCERGSRNGLTRVWPPREGRSSEGLSCDARHEWDEVCWAEKRIAKNE